MVCKLSQLEMIYTIHKGKHRPRWWWLHTATWRNKSVIRKKVVFDFNCIYDLRSNDQHDINKLFGLMPVPWWRLVWICISWPVFALLSRNRHHQDSARVGWRFDVKKSRFILSAYCYVKGQRITRDICECFANKPLNVVITVNPTFYEFAVFQLENDYPLGRVSVPFHHKHQWAISLGLFFGGNNPAPCNMNIEISNL